MAVEIPDTIECPNGHSYPYQYHMRVGDCPYCAYNALPQDDKDKLEILAQYARDHARKGNRNV